MDELTILLLGAGKRVSLAERLEAACRREGFQARLIGYENAAEVPIAALAKIVLGLDWDDPAFAEHLMETVRKNRVNLIVPCMDGATVALSPLKERLAAIGCWAVVSSPEICRTFLDKSRAQEWFVGHKIQVPLWKESSAFPWVMKRRRGFAARGQHILKNPEEFQRVKPLLLSGDYLLQPFIEGPEFSVDAYVSKGGKVIGCVSRRRIEICDGEVTRSRTERRSELIEQCHRILCTTGFEGPITLQAIFRDNEYYFLEINPRFGGGVPLTIEAGADYPWAMVREFLSRPVEELSWREGVTMARAYREVFFTGEAA